MIRKGTTDAIWDAATEEFYESGVPDTERSYVNKLVNALRGLKGITPAEIHRRTAELRADWGEKRGTICTLRALVRNWDQFPKAKPRRESRDESDAERRRRGEAAFLRRDVTAQQIIDRHTEEECEAAWQQYLGTLGRAARFLRNRTAWPQPVAERLEPGKLDEMMAEKQDDRQV